MSKSANTAVKGEPVRLKKRSYWGEVWHQLKKNPVSVICLVFLALLVLATIFSTWIAPYDYAQQDLMLRFAKPSLQHIMGCDAYGRHLRGHGHRAGHDHRRPLRLLRQDAG